MEGPPLGPGGEDITWPDQVAPRGRKASSTRKIKSQSSNLLAEALSMMTQSSGPAKRGKLQQVQQTVKTEACQVGQTTDTGGGEDSRLLTLLVLPQCIQGGTRSTKVTLSRRVLCKCPLPCPWPCLCQP